MWLAVHTPAVSVPAPLVPSPQLIEQSTVSDTPGSLTVAETSTTTPASVVLPDDGLSIDTLGGAFCTKKSTSVSHEPPPSTSQPSMRATYSPSSGQYA